LDLSGFSKENSLAPNDFYYTLCNAAGLLLQGKTVEVFGTVYSGDQARVKGMEMVDLIRVFERIYGKNRF